MNLENLAHPTTHERLKESGDSLVGVRSQDSFEVAGGIPILVDRKGLSAQARRQVAYFEKERAAQKSYRLEPWQESYVQRFLKAFGDPAGKLVVDCGTGGGYMAIELARRGARVIATDLTLANLAFVREAARQEGVEGRITLVCADAHALPIASGVADFFISNAVLEHLPDEPKAIAEMGRVCRPQAGLLIAVPISYRYIFLPLLPLNYLHDRRIGHLRRYDSKILSQRLKGWEPADFYYTGHPMKVLKTVLNMVIHIFGEEEIERKDDLLRDKPYGASNVIGVFKR